MVGADVVLVHRFLDEAQAKHLRVEGVVARRIGGDRGEVVEAVQLHGRYSCAAMKRLINGSDKLGKMAPKTRIAFTLEVMGEGWSMGPLNPQMQEALRKDQGDIKFPGGHLLSGAI